MEPELTPLGTAPNQLLSSCQDKDKVDDNVLHISLCSSGKFICLVKPDCTAQFMTLNESDDLHQYRSSFQGVLDVPRDITAIERPTATALAVIRIAFMRDEKVQSTSIAVVGFSNGYIRGFSKSGHVVLSEQLHVEPVSKICAMFTSVPVDRVAQQGNIVALVGSVACVIEGWSLVEIIQKNVTKMNTGAGWSEHDEDATHIVYRKWNLKEQVNCVDVALIGHATPSVYDYLCEASAVSGFEAVIRSGPIPEAKLISVGENPIVALYKLSKDAGQVNMTEVVHAVASKMKSAVLGRISQAGGWLGWGGQKQPKQQDSKSKMVDDALYRSSDLPMEMSIPDNTRCILSVTVSPLGDLAALVDSFGRVMLLDCDSMAVRRMWKGYRGAQCGWLHVNEKPSMVKLKGKARPNQPGKSTQCLCIYAAQRGILELWPTMYGKRIGAFHIGKGCRLLYSYAGVFATSQLLENDANKVATSRDAEMTVVLTPAGKLIKVVVPFSCILRSDDPTSSDVYLMKKFLQALKLGKIGDIFQLLSEIRSTKLLKQAVESVIKLHPIPNSPRSFLSDIISAVLRRINPLNHNYGPLVRYLRGCQQLIQLKMNVEKLHESSPDSSTPAQFSELLQQMLAMPPDLAEYVAGLLSKYYADFVPPKKVVTALDISSIIKSFNLPNEVGDYLLDEYLPDDECDSTVVELLLNDETDTNTLMDLGCTFLVPVLKLQRFSENVTLHFEKSGIRKQTLLLLLSHIFLSGKYIAENVTTSHRSLYNAFLSLMKIKDEKDVSNLWTPVCRQCAITSNVGHAFSIAIVHQKLSTDIENSTCSVEEGGIEDWESVSTEKGHWATLYSNLEILLHLSNLVGLDSLTRLPCAPFVDRQEDSSAVIEVANLTAKFYDKVYRNSSMCAASLKNAGPCLVSHCLCSWIVSVGYSPDFVISVVDSDDKLETSVPVQVIDRVKLLLKLLPYTLDRKHLLVHCAWQAAYTENEFDLSLQYLNRISDPQALMGTFGFLWCLKFENIIVRAIEGYKRGAVLDKESLVLVSLCRIVFGYMFQFSDKPFNTKDEDQEIQSQNRINLLEIVESYPSLHSTVSQTCLELLLAFEVAIQLQGPPINLMTMFPNWLRGSLKKGIYKSSWQEQVPAQLRHKRFKFLKEAVSICVERQAQPAMSDLKQTVFATSSTSMCTNVTDFQDYVFLLGRLWKLDLDELKSYWTVALLSSGVFSQGKSIFLIITDKSIVLGELLSLAGYLTDQQLHQIHEKQSKLAVLAQIPPTLLEWMRKQSSTKHFKHCSGSQMSWKHIAQIVTLIIPYFSEDHSAKERAIQLDKIIKLVCST